MQKIGIEPWLEHLAHEMSFEMCLFGSNVYPFTVFGVYTHLLHGIPLGVRVLKELYKAHIKFYAHLAPPLHLLVYQCRAL